MTHNIAQYIGPSEPLEVVSAAKADRIAWIAYERGMRNVYTAAPPDFRAVRLTNFMDDNGVDLTAVSLSADGSTAVFVRGGAANRQGWIADPGHDPNGGDRAIWAVRTTGGAPAIRVAEGQAPTVSPDGKWVLYARNNEIYRARTSKAAPPTQMDTGGRPFINLWGNNGQPHWSPDGSKIAFVSMRENHSLIGLYDVKSRKVSYVAPSVDCDGSPVWSPDGKQIAFLRRPGTPFGLQAQQGGGGIGNPGGVAAAQAARARRHRRRLRRVRRTRRRWRGRRRAAVAAAATPRRRRARPGSTRRRSRAATRSRCTRTTWPRERSASSGTVSRTTVCSPRSTPFAGPGRA